MIDMVEHTDLPDDIFDDHPSVAASLEDFEHNDNRSPIFGLPSQHSGFKSEESEGDAESESTGPWSPPASAWKSKSGAGAWYRHQPYQYAAPQLKVSASPSKSRQTSPRHESVKAEEGETVLPADIPLPPGSRSPTKERSPSPDEPVGKVRDSTGSLLGIDETLRNSDSPNNYFRFAVRAEVQQRTEPIEATLSWIRTYWQHLTKSKTALSVHILVFLLSIAFIRLFTHTPTPPPTPDLVKVAGLARSFEPLIFYSEHGVQQIGDLQETGVAVWDLGESVRSANMTSAPIIVDALDTLSDSLKTLSVELTKFFANVDGDIDGILIVMEWAKRELEVLSSSPQSSLSSAFTNVHNLLAQAGILENRSTGLPTTLGKIFTGLFGATQSQRSYQTLQRTFIEFLSVLEESINSELTYSTSLFALFEGIDRQFLNLQRTVVRETDAQERMEGEFLSSLWVRIVGPSANTLRIYEKNKKLLASVRAKTTQNKGILVEHNGKLIALKGNLETLRRKLVSPLVRKQGGSTIGVEEQIKGLEGTYEHLKGVREKQKGRVLEVLYGAGSKRATISREGTTRES